MARSARGHSSLSEMLSEVVRMPPLQYFDLHVFVRETVDKFQELWRPRDDAEHVQAAHRRDDLLACSPGG